MDTRMRKRAVLIVALVCTSAVILYTHLTYILWEHYILDPDTSYVCMTFNGRLGNHMFQYASIFGIARRNNFSIILGKDDDLVQYFEVPSAEVRANRDVCQTFTVTFAEHCCTFDKRLVYLEKGKNYRLGEYLQSWKYFDHVIGDLRSEFTFKKSVRESAEYIIENYRKEYEYKHSVQPVVVGVHVRRGDMVGFGDVWQLPSRDFYYRGFELFQDKYRHVVFIVCTEPSGLDYTRDLISNRTETMHLVHTSTIEDLAILSHCDHVIISLGTYSWFAGFLSGGEVVYFGAPINPENEYANTEYKYEDYFLPEWIALE